MGKENFSVIITSISEPGDVLKGIADKCLLHDLKFYVIGDRKSPVKFHLKGCEFYSINDQKDLNFRLVKEAPENHYSRKNIGYLIAISNGCKVIVETDDDNIPMNNFWDVRRKKQECLLIENKGWINICSHFSDEVIWARGFPLEYVKNNVNLVSDKKIELVNCPIQQGLADNNPDVDAVYRMTKILPVTFKTNEPIAIGEKTWHPFNSQNTTWFSEAFPLLYLPSFCSFRMTDIWRSFVAQRIAWTCNWKILFHNASVYQVRNDHNLLKDFEDEIPGYLNNAKICNLLQNLKLKAGKKNIYENLRICYSELVHHKYINNEKELTLLNLWIEDIKSVIA